MNFLDAFKNWATKAEDAVNTVNAVSTEIPEVVSTAEKVVTDTTNAVTNTGENVVKDVTQPVGGVEEMFNFLHDRITALEDFAQKLKTNYFPHV